MIYRSLPINLIYDYAFLDLLLDFYHISASFCILVCFHQVYLAFYQYNKKEELLLHFYMFQIHYKNYLYEYIVILYSTFEKILFFDIEYKHSTIFQLKTCK